MVTRNLLPLKELLMSVIYTVPETSEQIKKKNANHKKQTEITPSPERKRKLPSRVLLI